MRAWIFRYLWTLTFCYVIAHPFPLWAQDVIPDLKALRADYPTPMTKAQLSDLMNRVALRHPGWGMLRKDAGNNCPTAYPGISISCDWMVHGPTRWGYDLIIDQEGRAEIVGRSDGDAIAAGAEIVYPWMSGSPAPTPSPQPTPQPTPQPSPTPVPAVDLTPLLQAIQAVSQQNERIFENLTTQHDNLSQQLKAHDESPSFLGKVFGNTWVQMALVGIGTYYGTKQVTQP